MGGGHSRRSRRFCYVASLSRTGALRFCDTHDMATRDRTTQMLHAVHADANTGRRRDRDCAHVETLHGARAVSILEWRCPGVDPYRPAEELGTEYEIVVNRRGTFAREIRGKHGVVHAGMVTFWQPGDVYRIQHPLPGGDICSIIRLPATTVRELLSRHDVGAADAESPRVFADVLPIDGAAYVMHRLAVAAAWCAHTARGADRLATIEAEERALAFAEAVFAAAAERTRSARIRRGPRPGGTRLHADYSERVEQLLATRFREPLSLDDIARAVGCSPFHLSRIVTATVGVPIYRLVLRLRLRHVLERLLETGDHISAIAADAGFASHSHLGGAFRREFGTTPSEVRRLGAKQLTHARRPAVARKAAGSRA